MRLQWLSFLDGRQRVLMFTEDVGLVVQLQSAVSLEPIERSVAVSLHAVAVSLVDAARRREVLYAGVTSSGVVWETARETHHRSAPPHYRPMSIRDNGLLEEAYQQYALNLVANPGIGGRLELDGGRLAVDLREGRLLRPKERLLRRSYRSGVELALQSSAHRLHVHARLNRLQMDNQLDDCVFPVVFAPVPPPRSLANESIPHPFVELSVVQLHPNHHHHLDDDDGGDRVTQFHYFKLLVQECHIRVDMSLVNALGALFVVAAAEDQSEAQILNSVQLDMAYALQGAARQSSIDSFSILPQ